jgi:uncharacterized membrane protein
MEKRVIGVVLTLLGIIAIIMCGYNFVHTGGGGNRNIREIVIYGLIGAVFFFAGIGLVRSTKDVMKNDEHVS